MKILKCSAAKVTTSLIEIIVEDANTRLLSNPVTSKYSKLISDWINSTKQYTSESKKLDDLNLVIFTAVYTEQMYSLKFKIGFSISQTKQSVSPGYDHSKSSAYSILTTKALSQAPADRASQSASTIETIGSSNYNTKPRLIWFRPVFVLTFDQTWLVLTFK